MTTLRDPADVSRGDTLDESFFRGQVRQVAPALLGTLLLVETPRGPVGGLVVESEAYVNAVDPACHLAGGPTPRTEPFFAGAGTLYVYAIHGHVALNVVTEHDGYPSAVLVRALEPTHGREVMRERRGFDDPTKLASGPGRLTKALGIDREAYDGEPLRESSLRFYRTALDPPVSVSARIGVTAAEDWPLRFTVADSDFVSTPVRDRPLDHDAVDRCYRRLAAEGIARTERNP